MKKRLTRKQAKASLPKNWQRHPFYSGDVMLHVSPELMQRLKQTPGIIEFGIPEWIVSFYESMVPIDIYDSDAPYSQRELFPQALDFDAIHYLTVDGRHWFIDLKPVLPY